MRFNNEVRRMKILHPIAWRKAKKDLELEDRLYRAIAGTLKAHGIKDEHGPDYEDEPSYDLMVAVMQVLRRRRSES